MLKKLYWTVRIPRFTFVWFVVVRLVHVVNRRRRVRIVDACVQRLAFDFADAGCQKKNGSGDFDPVAWNQGFDILEWVAIQSGTISTIEVSNEPVAVLGEDFTVPPTATIAVQHDLILAAPSDHNGRTRNERVNVAP